MNKHIYILGSNSFSGAHFVKHALKQGFTVTGVSRSPKTHPVFLPYYNEPGKQPEGFSFLQADLNHDLDALTARIHEDQPSYIVNFAAQGMVAESWQHPEQWLRTNALSPLILHDRLRKCPWLEKFVQISTPEVYGTAGEAIRENTCYTPSTPYAVSKATADMNLMCFFKAYNFPVVFTRAANVYGPCQQLYRIIPLTILKFLAGDTITLHGGGKSVRSFIHIADVCDATWKIMTMAEAGEIFHISSPDILSIRDLVLRIAQAMEVDSNKHVISGEERLGKDAAYLLDSSKLQKKFNWKTTFDLQKGINEVITWVKNNIHILNKMPQQYKHKA